MSIWNTPPDHQAINKHLKNTLCEHLGIEVTEIGDDFLQATMPVDHRTRQLLGILHGGASVSLAETLGSIAANLACKEGYYCLGLDINANHIRPGKPPYVTGIARPLHIGNSTSVWEIKIYNVGGKLVCISRLTMAVLKSASETKK